MGGILDVDVTNIYSRDVMIILTYIKTWLWCQDKFIYYRFMASEIVNVTKKYQVGRLTCIMETWIWDF